MMPRSKGLRILMILPLVLLVFGIGVMVVQQLWNWLMPAIFGLRIITFWQALGLLVLAKILFGGFGFHRHRSDWRHRMREKMANMTPEERERMRERMGRWCGMGETRPEEPRA